MEIIWPRDSNPGGINVKALLFGFNVYIPVWAQTQFFSDAIMERVERAVDVLGVPEDEATAQRLADLVIRPSRIFNALFPRKAKPLIDVLDGVI